jgi:hypothetical protein
MTPHVIRLRGPWQCLPLARAAVLPDGTGTFSTNGLPSAAVVPLPGDWIEGLGSDFRGLVRLSRRFSEPTGLSPTSRVFLAIEEIVGLGTVRINGQHLGTIAGESATRLTECLANLPSEFAGFFAAEPVTCPARWEILANLEPRSEVTIDVLSLAGGRLGLVSLEIEEP